MKRLAVLICVGLIFWAGAEALTVTREHYGFADGAQRNFREGGWNSSGTDTSEGSGKTWFFTLPSSGYINNTYHHVSGAAGYPSANISCSYTQQVNGIDGSGYNYYQDNGEDILNLGYTGYPNTVWNPPIPNGLQHYMGKTWQGNHTWTYGTYSIQGKVISEGTITTHLGTFAAVCVRYYYSTTNFSYYYYQWETAEYGIMAYALTVNGGMLYVLYQADANEVAADDPSTPSCSNLNVFPNPASGYISVAFEQKKPAPVSITLYNLRGQAVFQKSYGVLPAGSHNLSADFTCNDNRTLPPGLYLIRVNQAYGISTRRIMITPK